MKLFGRPELVAEPPAPAPPTRKTEVAVVRVGVSGGMEWRWEFDGDDARGQAQSLFDVLAGGANDNGWVRVNDMWAYRPDEIKRVTLTTESKEVADDVG